MIALPLEPAPVVREEEKDKEGSNEEYDKYNIKTDR